MIGTLKIPVLIILAILAVAIAMALRSAGDTVFAADGCTTFRLDAASNPLNPPEGSTVTYRARLRTSGDCTNATIVYIGNKGAVITGITAPSPWECTALANVVTCTTGETPTRTLITIDAVRETYIGPASTKPKATAWADGRDPMTATAQLTLP